MSEDAATAAPTLTPTPAATATATATPAPTRTRTPTAAPAHCRIKGNISGDERIYHTPGSPYYDQTDIDVSIGERWFCSEREARAAGWRPPSAEREDPLSECQARVNLNAASADELETLPGIGEVLARRIVAYRAEIGGFRRIEQLDDVRGIGPKTLDKIKPCAFID